MTGGVGTDGWRRIQHRLFLWSDMNLYIIDNYKEEFPDVSGRELTEILVRSILEEEGLEDTTILRTSEGKPYLASGGRCFSVSHCGSVFACVTSEENVGLDIQFNRSIDTDRIAARYFTEEEQEYINNTEDGFFRIWTRKEAMAKYTGIGLGAVLSGQSVLNEEDWVFTDLVLGDGLYGCVCTGARK